MSLHARLQAVRDDHGLLVRSVAIRSAYAFGDWPPLPSYRPPIGRRSSNPLSPKRDPMNRYVATLGAALLLLAFAIPALAGGNHNQPPCIGAAGLSTTYPVPCVTPTPPVEATPTPTPEPSPTPTPESNCGTRPPRPGVCGQPSDPPTTPTPTPSPVPSPTPSPAASPTPSPDATPELPAVPPLPPTDTLTADPTQEAPPAYLWLLGLAGLAFAFWPRRRTVVRQAHWVGREVWDQAHRVRR